MRKEGGREAEREGARKGRRRKKERSCEHNLVLGYCTHSSRKFCCGPMIEPGRQILQRKTFEDSSTIHSKLLRTQLHHPPPHIPTDSPGPSNRFCSSKLVMFHHVTTNQCPCPPQASCREGGAQTAAKGATHRHLQMNQICSVIYVAVSDRNGVLFRRLFLGCITEFDAL